MQPSATSRPNLPDPERVAPVQAGPSLAGRAALAVGLLVGFYLLAIPIGLALLIVGCFEIAIAGVVNVWLGAFCLVGGVTIIWSILPRPDRFVAPGAKLAERDQPELFRVIQEVADSTHQAMPAEVYLLPDVNASVTQRGGFLGIGSRRMMSIGLPLLQSLTVPEFKGVLAHEFGHFYGGDTQLGPWLYQTYAAIVRSLRGLSHHSSTLQQPFIIYGNMFLRVTHAVSRRQEFVADELAARTVGARTLVDGLKAMHGGSVAFDTYWNSDVIPLLRRGTRPPLAEGFTHFMRVAAVKTVIDRSLNARLSTGKTDPYDTHPSLPERIAALEKLPPGPADCDERPAIELLDEVPRLEREILAVLTSEKEFRSLKTVTWEDAASAVYLPMWEALVRGEAEALAGVTPAKLPSIAKDLPGFARALARANVKNTSFDDGDNFSQMAARTLGAALTVALQRHGWQISTLPGESVRATKDDTAIEPFTVPAKLSTGALSSQEWLRCCSLTGISDIPFGQL